MRLLALAFSFIAVGLALGYLVDRALAGPADPARPDLGGVAQEGETITVTGLRDGEDVSWERCVPVCVPIPGAVGATYKLTREDVGFRVRAVVSRASYQSHEVAE